MSDLGLDRVKTFRPRETGEAKLNLACCRNCELESDVACPVRRERSGGADADADAHPSRLDRSDERASSRGWTDGGCRTVDRKISRFPREERLHMPGSLATPGRPGACAIAPECFAFYHMHGVGTQNRKLSRLNGWPMRTPVNASPRPFTGNRA